MKPIAEGYGVKAVCPDCAAISYFDHSESSRELGYVLVNRPHKYEGRNFDRVHYKLLRCSGCGLGALATFHDNGRLPAVLESFYPRALNAARLPPEVPEGISREYREAEKCAAFEAWRAASALLRSTLEKTLKVNGYSKGSLQAKIDEAAADGVITSARRQKAHDDIRVLGNEVVHDEWREISETEVETALHYAQRILEDLYDDRPSVVKILVEKGRVKGDAG